MGSTGQNMLRSLLRNKALVFLGLLASTACIGASVAHPTSDQWNEDKLSESAVTASDPQSSQTTSQPPAASTEAGVADMHWEEQASRVGWQPTGTCGSKIGIYNPETRTSRDVSMGQGFGVANNFAVAAPVVSFDTVPTAEDAHLTCTTSWKITNSNSDVTEAISGSGHLVLV